jgi:hypothetical protein
MRWQLGYDDHTYELAGLYAGSPPQWTDRLVFIDGRLACVSPDELTGVEWFWVSQPDGLAYLAGRLTNACGRGEPTPLRRLSDAAAVVPMAPVEIAEVPPDSAGQSAFAAVGRGLLDSLALGAGLVLSPIAIGALPVVIGTISAVEAGRARVTVGMQWADAQRIVGDPAGRIQLPASATEVQVYGGIAGVWYVGIAGGQVTWISDSDDWLDALVKHTAVESQ